jgi:hypothetical protein
MKVIKEPPKPEDWTHRFNCTCGAELEACGTDLYVRTHEERFGVREYTYFVTCPFCNTRLVPRTAIPQHIKNQAKKP